jgi:putative DNA primase/helicase
MPRAADFAAAVREAVEIYAKTGKMLDAALVYGKHGIPIFPVDHRTKAPIPRREPDPTGKNKKGIPGTGGFYKATTDPVVITDWWKRNPRALIAVPMGPRSGVWCVDVDTGEEHADGVAEWETLLAEHEPFETREHRSATGGPHVLFAWEDERPIGCSKGELKDLNLSVKGEGGYIVIPPSVRKGRAYTVFRDIDPIKAPQWLVDAILVDVDAAKKRRAEAKKLGPGDITWPAPPTNIDLDELAAAMRFVPNDDVPREEWMAWGLCLFWVSGGSQRGFEIFDEWSRKSSKYHGGTHQRWFEMGGSPPNRTGAGKIFAAARANGWQPKLKPAPPTYTIAADPAAEARDKMREVVRNFLRAVDQPALQYLGNAPLPPIAHAACIDVGVGKTRITIEELAIWLKQKPRSGPVIYATPRHKLNEAIEERFAKQGITARICRGREAEDPQRDLLQPDKKMCLNLAAVELAKKCHAEIGPTCCKRKKERCRFFDQCGYQRQLRDRDGVQVWIVAIDTLFHVQRALDEPVAVIVDEALWQKGIRGVEANETFDWSVAIDSISNTPPPPKTAQNINSYSKLRQVDFLHLRHRLATALRAQPNNGGVDRKYLDAQYIDGTSCKRALGLEWERYTADVDKLGQQPGMSDTKIAALAANHELIDRIQHARRVIQIWEAAHEFLNRADIDVSGRLTLTQDNGQRTVEWRGIKGISKQFTLPTLMLDATLPPLDMLKIYHPRAEVVADIKVELPKSVHIRQLQGTPTSARKTNNSKRLAEIRRYILARYLELNRPLTLVICQQKLEEWLKQSGLPDDITVEHYNNITGIDAYSDVRLLLLIGRTAPGPQAMEALTAALTGKCPAPATAGNNGFRWYDEVKRGIRLRDGTGVETWCDQHPDSEVEAIRYQIHEAELVQALGRGRAVNRTTATPLDADLLFDTALPVTVDEVESWKPPSLLIETAIDGVMLTAECDLMKCWPHLWPNRTAATRTLRAGVPNLPGFEQIEYQLVGPKMNKRVGYFNRAIIPDPRAWLEANIGRLI